MTSGIVPFEEILQAVKDETGITNLRPYYDRIRRLIFRGEREIGYGGSVVLKKTKFISENNKDATVFYKVNLVSVDSTEYESVSILSSNPHLEITGAATKISGFNISGYPFPDGDHLFIRNGENIQIEFPSNHHFESELEYCWNLPTTDSLILNPGDIVEFVVDVANSKFNYVKSIPFVPTVYYDGTYIPFPLDFIEFEGIGANCLPIHGSNYRASAEGVRFNKPCKDDIIMLYWTLNTDADGNPIVTRNHEEAVIAYIVWKLYAPKIFLGVGNVNAKESFQQAFTYALLEARGDDAFPTLEEYNDLALLSTSERRGLLQHPTASYNYCTDDIKAK